MWYRGENGGDAKFGMVARREFAGKVVLFVSLSFAHLSSTKMRESVDGASLAASSL